MLRISPLARACRSTVYSPHCSVKKSPHASTHSDVQQIGCELKQTAKSLGKKYPFAPKKADTAMTRHLKSSRICLKAMDGNPLKRFNNRVLCLQAIVLLNTAWKTKNSAVECKASENVGEKV